MSRYDKSISIETKILDNSPGNAIKESRFESSPISVKESECKSKEPSNDNNNLINIAMKIMDDCEINLTAEAIDDIAQLSEEPTMFD